MQAEIDSYYDQFVETVAAGRRRMSADAIRGTEARTYKGQDAVIAGLADAIGTFEDVLSELSGAASKRAAAGRNAPRALGQGNLKTRSKSMKKVARRRPAAQEGEAVVTLNERGDWESGVEYIVDDAVTAPVPGIAVSRRTRRAIPMNPGSATRGKPTGVPSRRRPSPKTRRRMRPPKLRRVRLLVLASRPRLPSASRILGIDAIAVPATTR